MRTNIEIDDELMNVLKEGSLTPKKKPLPMIKIIIKQTTSEENQVLQRKINMSGSLDSMRTDV